MKIGSIEILPVVDGESRPPLEEIVYRDGGDMSWDCPEHPLGPDGHLTFTLGGYLVMARDRTILVDAGIGGIQKEGYRTGELPDSLRKLGVAFEDVTDVVFTHLHYDHVGWATRKGDVMFPNATYRAHVDDWSHFVTGPEAVAGAVKKLEPLTPQLEAFDTEVEFAPGVIARPAPGHTPGSTIFMVADGGERALLLGDVTHTVAELNEPEWYSLYDLDRDAARAVREKIAQEALAEGDAIAAAHFPGLRFGRLVTTDGRRRFHYV